MRQRCCCAAVLLALGLASPILGQQTPQLTPGQLRARDLAREQWQNRGRNVPASAALRWRAVQQRLWRRTLLPRAAPPGGFSVNWTSVGPQPLPSDASGIGLQDFGLVAGRATAVAIDPNDPSGNTVFAGAANGGIWKSTNAGALSADPASVAWTPLTDNQLTLATGSIAVQPQTSAPDTTKSIVLVGTGETNSTSDSYYGLGILRSTDGGNHWSLISSDVTGTHSFAGLGFSQIAFSRANPNKVVAAAASASGGIVEGLENPLNVNRGLYYSADAGASWSASSISDAGVSVGPASVTSVTYNAATGKFYAAVRFHGFYSSADGGATWTRLASQPGAGLSTSLCPTQVSGTTCPIYRGQIAVVPNRAGPSQLGEMYVWYVDANSADQGIWTSTNGGNSWSYIDDSGITSCGDFFGGCGTEAGSSNLTLAAVPNGLATDLYAGAANIYKCTVAATSPNCTGTDANTFLNLTHVYGCSDIAGVHPGQHAIDFAVTGGAALLYFANDGGINRALDGFTGLTNGTCGSANQFDNLNAKLGPTTQFVSIAQSSTNQDLLWGGAEANGAPATAFLQSGGQWVNVNGGDNGFTAISPVNDHDWFVSTPPDTISGVNIFRCDHGVNCHTQDFQNYQVVSSNSVGGDTGPFFAPFLFDPMSADKLLVGTCRVWEGPSSGGSYTALSPNFEYGGSGACSGGETNLVRALATGGPSSWSGTSQVIYAGTDGKGPLVPTSPAGGRVWVTTDAEDGPATWADRTGNINPQAFPISSIAVDAADSSGLTAYVAIMGFGASHVWKTGDGGLLWIDFTGNLPDAPANALAIDTMGGTLYVGTDVGVFETNTNFVNWSEVGPASSSGKIGFLPNVAVTSLQVFNAGGVQQLRAGTYGRGIWQADLVATPGFKLAMTNTPQTVFAGTTAIYKGIITARYGYNSSVNLTCISGNTAPPQNCLVSPGNTIPAATGTTFVVNAAADVGDYSFGVQAAGTDPSSVTHAFPLALHVVDFSLAAPSPAAIALFPGTSSSSISLLVTAAGAFSGGVTMSCGALPAGISCHFQPTTVSPTAANPKSVALTLMASSSAAIGSFQLTIMASASDGVSRTQQLALNVAAKADYSVTITNSALSALVNATSTFNGMISTSSGYSSSVALGCTGTAPPSCVVSPASVTPSSSGTPFSVAVNSAMAQAYNFSVTAIGSDPAQTTHSAPLTFTALPNPSFDFSVSLTPLAATVVAGNTSSFSIALAPNAGTFANAVTFACSGLPALSTCSFNPAQIASGAGNSVVTLTIATTAPVVARISPLALPFIALLFPFAGWKNCSRRSNKVKRGVRLLWCAGLGCLLTSCGSGLHGNGSGGGSGSPGTPVGSYTVNVTTTAGTVVHSTQISLTVTGR